MDNLLFNSYTLVFAGTLMLGVLILAVSFLAFFAVVAAAAAVRGVFLLARPVTILLRSAQGAPVSAARPAAPLQVLAPVVREKLSHGLNSARTHAGSAAVGLAHQAGKAAKASTTKLGEKLSELKKDTDRAA
ncbi:hypothetical protein [Specibacter sp. RAF43]|uniref:hypothetical protein n=1 Tax=Specibacter sp. RAF43 TaxID=3233057 RepID=UPI003F9CD23A